MEYILALVIDKDCKVFLPLEKKDINALDEYTSKKYRNSDEIREHYKAKIDEYLRKNQEQIDRISETTHRHYRGSIVLLKPVMTYENGYNKLSYVRKKVLYKKHVATIPMMVSHQEVMKRFLVEDKIYANEEGLTKLIAAPRESFEVHPMCYHIYANNYYKASNLQGIRSWIKSCKNDYYRKVRLVSSAYEFVRREQLDKGQRPLPTIDSLYSLYLDSKKKKVNQTPKPPIVDETIEDKKYNIDGVNYYPDEIPFDLEELKRMDSEYQPDGLGPRL